MIINPFQIIITVDAVSCLLSNGGTNPLSIISEIMPKLATGDVCAVKLNHSLDMINLVMSDGSILIFVSEENIIRNQI